MYSYRCGSGLTVTASKQTPLPVTGTTPLTGPASYQSAKNLTGCRGLTAYRLPALEDDTFIRLYIIIYGHVHFVMLSNPVRETHHGKVFQNPETLHLYKLLARVRPASTHFQDFVFVVTLANLANVGPNKLNNIKSLSR